MKLPGLVRYLCACVYARAPARVCVSLWENSECFIVEGHLTHYKWYDYKHAHTTYTKQLTNNTKQTRQRERERESVKGERGREESEKGCLPYITNSWQPRSEVMHSVYSRVCFLWTRMCTMCQATRENQFSDDLVLFPDSFDSVSV